MSSSRMPCRLCKIYLPQVAFNLEVETTHIYISIITVKLTSISFPLSVQNAIYHQSVLNFMGLVLSWVSWVAYHCAIVPSWVQNFFSWVFRGCLVGPKIFLVGTSWVQKFLLWVLHRPKIFFIGILLVLFVLKPKIV